MTKNNGEVVFYIDQVSTNGRLVVTSLDLMHHVDGFFPMGFQNAFLTAFCPRRSKNTCEIRFGVLMQFYSRMIMQYALTLLAALTLKFFLPRLAPGDPLDAILTPDVIESMTEQQRLEVPADFGLDLPLWHQFWNYLTGLFSGNFGVSTTLGMQVGEALMDRLLWTLPIMGCALLISMVLGVAFRVFAVRKRGEIIDVSIISSVLFVGSLPPFWLAMMLIILFSATLGWLPLFGAYKLGVPQGSWAWRYGRRGFGDRNHVCLSGFGQPGRTRAECA